MYSFITEDNKSCKRVKGNDKSAAIDIFSEAHSLQINC